MTEVTALPGHGQGQKPVHLTAATGYRTPQDCIWEAVRATRKFTLHEIDGWIAKNCKQPVNTFTLKSYLSRLQKGFYISVIDVEQLRGIAKEHSYELVNDTGIHAPRLTREGMPSTQGLGRENLWRSMKMLKSFDFRDLVKSGSTGAVKISEAEARDYIKHLYKAGYLQQLQKVNRQASLPARYRLLPSKNTGPRPPMIQRIKRVFDPNLNEVVWGDVETDKGDQK
jgi:hypothetical protein